jgi:hypothetical protein
VARAEWNHLCRRVLDEFGRAFDQSRSLANLKNPPAAAINDKWQIATKEGVLTLCRKPSSATLGDVMRQAPFEIVSARWCEATS